MLVRLKRSAVAAVLLVVGPSPAAGAGDGGGGDDGGSGKPRVVVIGDSITHWGEPYLRERHPRWTVDGERGRSVTDLPGLVAAHLEDEPTPRAMVLALGSNGHHTWTAQGYVDALALVPAETPVLFVTVYRDPAVFGEERAARMREYSAWMREAAQARPGTSVAPWRWRVLRGKVELRDGVHAARPDGERYWARLVVRQVRALLADGS